MTARLGTCPRCRSSTIPGVTCGTCVRESARTLELVEAMRHVARVFVWFEADAWFRRENGGEGRASMLAVILGNRRAA